MPRFSTLRFALRSLRRNPSYALVVALTLAFGIAANTLIFSLMNPYFFRPLPFRDAAKLVQLGHIDAVNGWDGARFSYAQLRDYAEHTTSLDGLAAYFYRSINLTGAEGAERQTLGELTTDMLGVLGASPILGAGFTATADGLSDADTVLLSHELWQRRFGGDPEVVGRSLDIDGTAHEIVGVMPPGFQFPFPEVRLWRGMSSDLATTSRQQNGMLIVARLAPGFDIDRAREELDVLQSGFAAAHPEADGRYVGISVTPIREALNFAWNILRVSFIGLLAAVAAVLLIACVNVAGLTLARAAGRRREVALRAALGARRGRLMGQMLVEGVVLALAGGALGVGMSFLGVGLVGSLIPASLYRVGEVSVDLRVLGFAALTTLLTPLFFAVAPAWSASCGDLVNALRDGGRSGGGRGALRARRGLVIAEVALAVVLTASAGLMLRSLWALGEVDLGFAADRILTVEVTVPESRFPSVESRDAFYDRAQGSLGALPGVTSVGQVSRLPLNNETIPTQHAKAGAEPGDPDAWPVAITSRVSGDYFATMGIRVVAGRSFAPTDGEGERESVVISRRIAERHWPDESAIGQTLVYGDPGTPERASVVGVVEDLVFSDLAGNDPRGHIYRSIDGSGTRRRFIVLATDGAPSALSSEVAARFEALDPNQPISLRTMDDVVGEGALQWRLGSIFLGLFGVMAVLLAAVGLYGLIAYTVALRRPEMGVRASLGATRGDLRRLVVGEGLRLTVAGLAIGLPAAIMVGKLASSMLYGTRPYDPPTMAAVLVLIGAAAALASLGPADRAARVDPAEVLREM